MNNKPQALDPKMKAIYDQVMGTVVTPPTPEAFSGPQPISTIPVTKYTLPVAPPTARPTLISEPTTQLGPNIPVQKGLYGSLPPTPVVKPSATIDKVSPYNPNYPQNDFSKNKSPIMPIILTLSGLIFFIVYTVFWIKFFGIPIPFLPI